VNKLLQGGENHEKAGDYSEFGGGIDRFYGA
jgi:hypothetical protein